MRSGFKRASSTRGTAEIVSMPLALCGDLDDLNSEILAQAVEAVSDGFVIFDDEQRLVLCNSRYRELYAPVGHTWGPGTTLATMSRDTATHCLGIAECDVDDWVRRRLATHREHSGWVEQGLSSGRWLRVAQFPLANGWTVGLRTDITAVKLSQFEAQESAQRFEDFASAAADWFWETDTEDRYTYVSGGFEARTGVTRDVVIGRDRMALVDKTLEPELWESYRALVAAREPLHKFEFKSQLVDGSVRIYQTSGVPRFSQDGEFLGYRGAGRDVTESRSMTRRLRHQATHDALTGLLNRYAFEQRVTQALIRARDEGVSHVLCYLDLDQFKVVNDTCGHVAGDALLKQLSTSLSTQVRRDDTLSRLGGDEFGVLLANCGIDIGQRIAEKIRAEIEEFRFSWGENTFRIGASIGLAVIDDSCTGLEDVLSAADTACYAAKERGRNCVQTHLRDNAEMERRRGEMRWVPRIQKALETDQFELFYQPITPVNQDGAGQGIHCEILLRLRDNVGALVAPGAFLPAAERYDQIAAIDVWVFESVLRWLQQHPQVLAELHVCSVNVSGSSIARDDFAQTFVAALRASGVPPQRICFEITESSVIANLDAATRAIAVLKSLGCKFALDDFGSGLSSFAYLKNLDVDYLKIDGQFVRDLAENEIDQAMVRSINDIGHVMGKTTIAEFVEDEASLQVLREIGVDYAQGYLNGKPAPLAELASSIEGSAYPRRSSR